LLILVICAAVSCRNEKPFDINKAEWRPVDSLPFLHYCVSGKETSSVTNNDTLFFYGWQRQEKIIPDSVNNFELSTGHVYWLFTESKVYKTLPAGTAGYLKLGLSGQNEAERQFVLFYNKDPDKAGMQRDSAALASMNVFGFIEVIDHQKMKETFAKGDDAEWLKILEENPMPVSIDLKLRQDLQNTISPDSLTTVLRKKFPQCDATYRQVREPGYIDPAKGTPIFKFVLRR
jgi:hypothetical protein